MTEMLTREYLQDCIAYSPETGVVTWLTRPREHFVSDSAMVVWNKKFAGKLAGGKPDLNGYCRCSINNAPYPLHRLIWLLVTGAWPFGEVDHIDRNRSNNQWGNLRDVDRTTNSQNTSRKSTNTSGHCGVVFDKRNNRWQASITVRRDKKFLGRFKTKEEAIAARKNAELEHGFSAGHGEPAPK